MFVRASIADMDIASTYDGKKALTLFNNAAANRVYSLAIANTFLFTPTIVGSFRAGLNRAEIPKVLDDFPGWRQLGVVSGTDRALNGEGGQRGDLIAGADPYITENNSSFTPAPCYRWLNRSAFAIPALGAIGNLGQYNIPKIVQFDMAVTRTFSIREGQTFQVRGEAFNAPNRVNLDNPTPGLNSGAFGNILSAGDPRIIQLALKYVF